MGYKVKVVPAGSAAGWLARGQKTESPTYYHHPGPAIAAAAGYIRRHPGDTCQVVTWRDEALVEEVEA